MSEGGTDTESDDAPTDDVAEDSDPSDGSDQESEGDSGSDSETGDSSGSDEGSDTEDSSDSGSDSDDSGSTGTDSGGSSDSGDSSDSGSDSDSGTDSSDSSGSSDSGSTDSGGTATCSFSLTHDFAACDEGWTTGLANGSSAASTWECGDPTAYSQGPGVGRIGVWGTNLAGDYNNSESSYAASPVFSLVECAGAPVRMVFEHWYNFEGGASNADGGIVQVSIDGGSNWTTVEPDVEGYYQTSTLTTEYAPPDGEHGFSALASNRVWRTSEVDMTAFGGETQVAVRFVLGTNSATPRAGWYIDSVTVAGD